jgi:plastocyanin
MRRKMSAKWPKYLIVSVVLGLITVASMAGDQWEQSNKPRVIDVIAFTPENGGFKPDSIKVREGETVTLRFKSGDVRHGIAIGPVLAVDLGNLDPGQVKQVTLTFDKGGTYTFYCNTWCSLKHWRMRGVVQVYSTSKDLPAPERDTVIDALMAEGVNIDAGHEDSGQNDHTTGSNDTHGSEFHIVGLPSIGRGMTIAARLAIPAELSDIEWRRSHTPAEALHLLSHENPTVSESDLIHAIAYLWSTSATKETLIQAEAYYSKNCAYCHGDTGNGQGFAAQLSATVPADFSDPNHMFMIRDDVLYAKIRRGGMGTDMPNFGTLLTPEETWQLVDYLRKYSTAP